MGYYASGDGIIGFDRYLKDEEVQSVLGLLSEEFEDSSFDNDTVTFWASEKYHGDAVESILNQIARDYPIKHGEVQYVGEDGCHWRFRFDHSCLDTDIGSPWLEEEGEVVFEGDRDTVLVLEHTWDTQFDEGTQIMVYAHDRINLARAKMRYMAEEVRQEWREMLGKDPWEKDYTWEDNDEIHLGFNTSGPFPMVNRYSWEISRKEVAR